MAAKRSAACRAMMATSTGSVLLGGIASKRASQSRSSTMTRIRLLSSLTRANARWYQSASRGWVNASDVCAWITASGVRNSCDALAVKSICRWRACSIGAATRRPIANAPRKTTSKSTGPISSSAWIRLARAWSTVTIDWPTTVQSSPVSSPATRKSVPDTVIVWGAWIRLYGAGRLTVAASALLSA